MGRLIDLTGKNFGDLVVISRAENDNRNQARWKCECSCGNICIVSSRNLREGKTTHCGCKKKTTLKDLTGQTFSRLTVITRNGSDKNKKAIWKCRCDCGNEINARGSDLLSGKIKSCGCYKTDQQAADLLGKRFGKLTVIDKIGSQYYGKTKVMYWLCECDCGNKIKVTTNHLTQRNTLSCGCLSSKGEQKICMILDDQKIKYVRQYTFPDLKGDKNRPLRFDFGIIDENDKLLKLIEFQGIQHTINVYNLSEEDWSYSLKRDQLKREYCLKNKILLLEINYLDDIETKLGEFLYDN